MLMDVTKHEGVLSMKGLTKCRNTYLAQGSYLKTFPFLMEPQFHNKVYVQCFRFVCSPVVVLLGAMGVARTFFQEEQQWMFQR